MINYDNQAISINVGRIINFFRWKKIRCGRKDQIRDELYRNFVSNDSESVELIAVVNWIEIVLIF